MGQMALLILFAFVAGAGTAITPCVLPVLPALLSASATGGRRRPLGIVARADDHVHRDDRRRSPRCRRRRPGRRRDPHAVAIVVLLVFGLALAVPALGDRLEAPLSRLARFGPKTGGDGFWSGVAGRRRARLRLRARAPARSSRR